MLITTTSFGQEKSIQDLDFLLGTWEVREDNKERDWWEKTTRIGVYALDSTYIQLTSRAVSSTGKKRTYRWYIHYNSKEQQYEMASMFGNWHKIQFDILSWDPAERKLTIKNGPDGDSEEYHERFGEIVFDESFKSYIWTGENKYGDPKDPGIWKYVEIGSRIN
ncbi:hypothetical protein DX873_06115 [Flagellimonas nanhaiensis]|uniref:DUF1579 domain-containing protein n=1 Tax=Flagellimonas nanhaiensis TaxID=2292706 RepID=A0A371JV84_9FLAO|nr:hypothetical protein DX873_06115 [Allomuricauda nanhaiensis]